MRTNSEHACDIAKARNPRGRRQVRRLLRVVRRGEAPFPQGRPRVHDRGRHLPFLQPDGRCVSLLKVCSPILVFDGAYASTAAPRTAARALPRAGGRRITLDFYRRTYIEGCSCPRGSPLSYYNGAFLRVGRPARGAWLRGYIHLKSIPDATPLIAQAAAMPTLASISRCRGASPRRSRRKARDSIRASGGSRRALRKDASAARALLAGRQAQMIVGADATNDAAYPHQRGAVRLACEAHLLRGVQPDSRCKPPAAAQGGAPRARAPALSGRLALSLLRFLGQRHHRRTARGHARPRHRPEARLGLAKSRALPN